MINSKVYNAEPVYSFKDLLNNTAERYPDNIAYKFKKNLGKEDEKVIEVTYREFREDVNRLGTALLDLGLERKKIAIISNNRYEWCVSYLSITIGNMVVVPLDKALPEAEIEGLIKRSGAEAVIFEKKFSELFKRIRNSEETNLKHCINMDLEEGSDEEISFKELISKGKKELLEGKNDFTNKHVDLEKMSVLLFTSGTTDKSKGVMLSQANICSNISSMACMSKMYPTDTALSFLPLHHTFECTITFLYGLYSGITVAFCDGLRYIQSNLVEYKVSVFVAVPLVLETIYKKIIKGIEDKGKTKLIKTMTKLSNGLLKLKIDVRRKLFKQILDQLGGNIRIAYFGAAPMERETILGYNSWGIETVQGYGLTETSPLVSAETDKYKRPGSVGLAAVGVEMRIDDANEQGIGEVVVKGPNVMLGYYNDEEKTKEAFEQDWFKTGDLGYIDKDGYLYITGRKKDVIVLKNGENIYPQEIEFLINKIPYVTESLVYAREGKKTELMLGAKIVYNKESMEEKFGNKTQEEYKEIIWEEIKNINRELSTFKRIKEIIVTDEPLEKTTTQKVKRFQELTKILSK